MEVITILFAILLLSYSSKVKKLKKQLRKMKQQNQSERRTDMSKIITELIGKSCNIATGDSIQIIERSIILDVDMDWVKLEKTNKKGVKSTQIIRIDEIKKIDVLD